MSVRDICILISWESVLEMGLPCGLDSKESACNVRDMGLIPLLGRSPGWGSGSPVFLPGEFHGQRSLAGYSPWDHRESDTTEQLTHIHRQYWNCIYGLCWVSATSLDFLGQKRWPKERTEFQFAIIYGWCIQSTSLGIVIWNRGEGEKGGRKEKEKEKGREEGRKEGTEKKEGRMEGKIYNW